MKEDAQSRVLDWSESNSKSSVNQSQSSDEMSSPGRFENSVPDQFVSIKSAKRHE